jgi:hypothetical protein
MISDGRAPAAPCRRCAGDDRVRNLQVLGEGGVLDQVAALAVGRHGDLVGRAHWYICQLVAARVAADVDAGGVALGVQAHAAVGQLVLQVADRDLVARDDPRAEDHVVALRELDVRVGAVGDRARAARASPWLPVHRNSTSFSGRYLAWSSVMKGSRPSSRPTWTGGGAHAVHRAAGQADLAAGGLGGADHGVHARHVRGEAGHGDLAGQAGDQLVHRHADVGFRAGRAVDEDVGAVADHGQHALVAEALDGVDVGGAAQLGIGIDLPVAGVQDRAQRRLDRQAVRLGDRVGQGDQFQVERAESKLPPSGTSVIGTSSSRPASRSFSRSRKAVNGVA